MQILDKCCRFVSFRIGTRYAFQARRRVPINCVRVEHSSMEVSCSYQVLAPNKTRQRHVLVPVAERTTEAATNDRQRIQLLLSARRRKQSLACVCLRCQSRDNVCFTSYTYLTCGTELARRSRPGVINQTHHMTTTEVVTWVGRIALRLLSTKPTISSRHSCCWLPGTFSIEVRKGEAGHGTLSPRASLSTAKLAMSLRSSC
jgi:hypothetical protein